MMPHSGSRTWTRGLALPSATGALALLLSLASSCATQQTSASSPAAVSSCSADAPDFILPDVRGNDFRLSNHLGRKPIVLFFWKSWSNPSKLELAQLARMHQQLGDRVVFAAIATDRPISVADVQREADKAGADFPILVDENSDAVALYDPETLIPYTVFIDRCGHVVKRWQGFLSGDRPRIEAELHRLAGE